MAIPNPALASPSGEVPVNIPRSDCFLDDDPKCLDTSLNFSTLISATFAVLDLIFNLWNTTSPLLNLILFYSQKHSSMRQLTVAPSLSPPTFSILIFAPKLDIASMCTKT
ncbi:hypothetical protein E2C01_021952 [Portunus trituberculatus]|uniref:Uncharacterized protein n=1 Tax=Portunus trituberculatus TaxID=210409 RepID=A0A5B7E3Y8_PORTR|nr:hypothetical protein [Portunus trituberculatus]